MRPRPLGRGERSRVIPLGTNRRKASMRPRPLGRGEQDAGWRQQPADDASMRPRPLGRGELECSEAYCSSHSWLQCGHGLSAVENLKVWNYMMAKWPLQCGHGLSAVENLPSRTKG